MSSLMDGLAQALLYAAFAGATIPLGAFLARIERIRPKWLEQEFRHAVLAFGGGILVGAVALVLVPEGQKELPVLGALVAFGAGGAVFMGIDRALERRGRASAQLVAMLLDFAPEAIALGAMLATGNGTGLLLAVLIAFQNLPEGFNAYREIVAQAPERARRIFFGFCLLALLGPLAAFIGHQFLSEAPGVLGSLLLFAAGGILYLTFQDLAPAAHMKNHWAPPLGAVGGFAVALAGHMLTAG